MARRGCKSELAPRRRLDLECDAFLDDDNDVFRGADLDDRSSLAGKVEIKIGEFVRRFREAASDTRLGGVARIERSHRAQCRGRDLADGILDRLAKWGGKFAPPPRKVEVKCHEQFTN